MMAPEEKHEEQGFAIVGRLSELYARMFYAGTSIEGGPPSSASKSTGNPSAVGSHGPAIRPVAAMASSPHSQRLRLTAHLRVDERAASRATAAHGPGR